MKKMYFLILLCLCFSSVNSQIVANDDVTPILNTRNYLNPGFIDSSFQILSNDSLNGEPVNFADVIISLVESSHPGLTLNTFNGILYLNSQIEPGEHTLTYQICEAANPSNCDTATVTIHVCEPPDVTITANNPICADPDGSISFENMPEGNWEIWIRDNTWEPYFDIIPGSGSSYVLENPGFNRYYSVITNEGCISNWHLIRARSTIANQYSGIYQDDNNDGVVNVGDSVVFQITTTNNRDCSIYNLTHEILYIDGTVSGSPLDELSPGETNSEVAVTIPLTQAMIHRGEMAFYVRVEADSESPLEDYGGLLTIRHNFNFPDGMKIEGFRDTNQNGIRDEDEGLLSGQIEITDSNGVVQFVTNGTVFYDTNPANTYDLSWKTSLSSLGQFVSPVNFQDINIPIGSGIVTYELPVVNSVYLDKAVYITALGQNPRPGLQSTERIYVRNISDAQASGELNYTKDPRATIVSILDPLAVITPQGFQVPFMIAEPQGHIFYDVILSYPDVPELNIGEIVTCTAVISSDTPDMNDSFSLSQVVINSFDPNTKSESHAPEIPVSDFSSEDYLCYTIHFENTGTADALNVKVTDLIDENLDLNTFKIVYSTHNYHLVLSSRQFTFEFWNINLPPSVEGTQIGHGEVMFRIKPLPGYQHGDIIHNTANIYFDGNEPIVTNTVTTTFVAELSISDLSKTTLRLYPNPAKTNLHLSGAAIQSMEIFDMTGKMVLSKTENAASGIIDVSGLAGGIYLVKVKTDASVETIRFVKE